MTDRVGFRIVAVVIAVGLGLVGSGLGTGAGASTAGADVPVTVQHTFTGTSAESEHAVAVALTVAPTEETGAINNTSIRVTPTAAAFLAPPSISTSETAGGDQVITQSNARPVTFELTRLEPGETVTIRFRLHPKAVAPDGDPLANVHVQTQFVQNRRQASATKTIAPAVDESTLAFTVAPAISPPLAGGIGAAIATVLVGGVAYVLRRRRRAAIVALLRPAKPNVVNAEVRRAIEQALAQLGVDSASDAPRAGGERPGGRGGSTGTEEHPVEREDTGSSGSDETVLIDFDD
jgi:hypothetical protein